MLVVILLYDQLLFRPLLAWSASSSPSDPGGDEDIERPWFLDVHAARPQFFELQSVC
jgi:hypothetical protein